MIRNEIREYIEQNIIPQYDNFDKAHRRDHARTVIERSATLAATYDVDAEMIYVAAAYHDTGLAAGREEHHRESARIIRSDNKLRLWFTPQQIDIIAEAAEDHRASSDHAPRTLYGRIIAEADRTIDPQTIFRRTVQYSFAHYPEMNREQHFARFLEHMNEKYAEGGYLKLWIEESENAERLRELRSMIADKEHLRRIFDTLFDEECGK